MESLDENELEKFGVQVSEQLEKVKALKQSTSINSTPIGKEIIDNYTKYIFLSEDKANTDGGIKEVCSIQSYSISSAGKLEEKSHIYKTLKSGKDRYVGVDKQFSALFAEALTESANKLVENANNAPLQDKKRMLQDSNNLKEAVKSIQNVATVIIGPKKYEQHEKWGEDALHYFAPGRNQNDAKEFSRQLSLQLKILHNAGIVHYDLKLENVLVKKENGQLKVRIIDFDLVYNIENPLKRGFIKAGSKDKYNNFITSFSGRSDSLSEGEYQKVNDMKGYLYTLWQVSTDAQTKECYRKTLFYLTDMYNERVTELTRLGNSEWTAKSKALTNLYDQGFGEVDKVDLFVKFTYYFQSSTTLAIECYNHFKDDSDFKGQGQPMESFAGTPFEKIKRYTQGVIDEYQGQLMGPSSRENNDDNFRKALKAREVAIEVKEALEAFAKKFSNQTGIYQGENRELIAKLILNIPESNPLMKSFYATCCLLALSDKDKETLREYENEKSVKRIFNKAWSKRLKFTGVVDSLLSLNVKIDLNDAEVLSNLKEWDKMYKIPKFTGFVESLLSLNVKIGLNDAEVLSNLIELCGFDRQRANAIYPEIMKEENKDLLKVLIANGSDKDVRDRKFFTALIKQYPEIMKEENKDLLKVLIANGSDKDVRDRKVFTALIKHLKDPVKAKKYYDFIDDSTKGKLAEEIVGDSFNAVGQKRVEVIGVSIEIHEKLEGKWSFNRYIPFSKSKYNERRANVKEQLLALHAPEHKHGEISLNELAVDLQKIKYESSMARDVKTRLKTVSNKLSSTETPPDIGPGSS